MEDSKKYIEWLEEIKKEANGIVGLWNGDNNGSAEERAGIASDITTHCNDIISLINELNF